VSKDLPRELETKYYQAPLSYEFHSSMDVPLETPKEIQAWVLDLFHDASLRNELSHIQFESILKSWTECWTNSLQEPCIKLCLLSSSESGALAHLLQDWCLENQVEIIQMGGSLEQEEEEEDDGFKQGWDRIREALEAHHWPEMTLKGTNAAKNTDVGKDAIEDVLPSRSEIQSMHQKLFGFHSSGEEFEDSLEEQDSTFDFEMLSRFRGEFAFLRFKNFEAH
jgi:hypothetical protein